MSLSEAGRRHILDLNMQLSLGQRYGEIPYDTTQVRGNGLTEIETTSELDLPILSAAGYAGYWPGGFPDGEQFAMVVGDSPLEYMKPDMAAILRQQIGQLSISRGALSRYHQRDRLRPQITQMRERVGDKLMPRFISICERAGSPLVYLTLGTWQLPKRYGQLFGGVIQCPVGMHPNIALENLKAHAASTN